MLFAKPESSLKRAEELINVGQKQEALQELFGLITSNKYKAWQKSHEKIMFKFIELCVDMQKGRYAKEGLIKYRSMCTQVNVNSLEEVIKHFLDLSTKKTEMARNQAQALDDALDVDDLEADQKPEDLMMSVVSGEKGKDRSDRKLVTPWFKFLWETYRTALEVLKNNSKLIALYADTMHRAFQFCKQYKRTTEFHRLCDILRHHLVNLNKYRDQRDRPDLTATENLHFYLDARFEQLKIATELELWQEAFRSVEDIYGLTCMVQIMPKASLMATYYAKLIEVFWMSASHLYHAYSWFKLFNLQKTKNKNQSQTDLQLIASSVLLAALSVPPYEHTRRASHLELEYDKERNLKMSNLIGFNFYGKLENDEVLSRSNLLAELVSKGVMTYATQEVKDIYHLLEHEFLPIDLASKIQPLLLKISKIGGIVSSASSMPEIQLSQYVPALEKLATLRLLQQVSQVYHSLTMESLSTMIPFCSFSDIAKLSVDAVKNSFIAMKVDHINGVVIFGNLGLESDDLHDQLRILAESLNKSRDMIYPPAKKICRISEMLPSLADTVNKEHKRLLARKEIIEKRKEDQERRSLQTEQEEDLEKERQRKLAEDVEKKRLDFEKQQRIVRLRREKEMEEIKAREDEEKERVRKMEEMKMKTKSFFFLCKKMDHFERAQREEAAPLIQAAFQRRLELERVLHERQQQEDVELSKNCHTEELKEKNRLSRTLEHKNTFEKRVSECKRAEFERIKAARDERINTTLAQRKAERDLKRKMIYFLNQEEEKRQKLHQEEEARKLAEAERRKKKEAERKKEEAERKAKLDEIAEKQRQREWEIEERERLRREAILGISTQTVVPVPSPETAPTAAAPPAPSTGKYIPKFRRSETAAPPQETDRWRRDDNRGPTRPWKASLRT